MLKTVSHKEELPDLLISFLFSFVIVYRVRSIENFYRWFTLYRISEEITFLLNKLEIPLSLQSAYCAQSYLFFFFPTLYTPITNFKETLPQEHFSFLQCECRSHFLKHSNYLFLLPVYFIKRLIKHAEF